MLVFNRTPVSSTKIRKAFSENRITPLYYYLNNKVYNFILEKKLYSAPLKVKQIQFINGDLYLDLEDNSSAIYKNAYIKSMDVKYDSDSVKVENLKISFDNLTKILEEK